VVHRYYSLPAEPWERGRQFGRDHADRIATVLGKYSTLFTAVSGVSVDLEDWGDEALSAIRAFSPDAAEEIEGLAEGAGVSVAAVAALNARTEILAALGVTSRGECSTVVSMSESGPVSVQTWDWHDLLEDDWLLWTIEHLDGRRTITLTEFGILGKIGVNDRGLGVHVNILHHRSDGGPIRVPIHVLSRTLLDTADGIGPALAIVGGAQVSASSVLTLIGHEGGQSAALCAELCPAGPRFVLPSERGLLLHTNHFLDVHSAAGDLELQCGPDSYLRMDVLRRALSARSTLTRDDIVTAMTSHVGGGGAVCCHPAADAVLGDRWQTLAMVALDVPAGTLLARRGGPCAEHEPWTPPLDGPL
jgi:isopenicillin-N N-acyltransferase-like protein